MRPFRTRPWFVPGSTMAVTVALVVASGCGLVFDETPRALDLGETTTTAPSSPSTGRFGAVLYFVREGTLLPTTQELPESTIDAAIEALLLPPSENQPVSGLGTSIPAGTEVLSVSRNQDRFSVDLSAAFDNVVGLSRQQAIGQIVLTVTQQVEAAQLTFSIEGRTLTVSSPSRGDRAEVDSCDYAGLMAGIDEAVAVGLQGESLEDLARRRAELAQRCLIQSDPGS